jgi:YidC/Oxa1 family membrane protein insertase
MDFLVNVFTTALLLLCQLLGQNIGLTIIVFAVLTRLAIFPLTQQQIKSSKAIQEIQPTMKQLREQYKNDREMFASEQMRLYREHNINPWTGCLPLVIQFLILIGLYGAIQHALVTSPLQALDLSHRLLSPGLSYMIPLQQKFLWLNLGAPDSLYIMPILVVAATYPQSKLMTPIPTTSDPNDPYAATARNLTLMMPLVLGLFSLPFPSGLSIYWVFSNLASVAQYASGDYR